MPLALLIPLLPQLIKAGGDLFKMALSIRDTAKQSNEWTPQNETDFLESLIQANSQPHWQPESK